MHQLLDLPNELLLDIINVVPVGDIEAFTSCNKRIHALSYDVLQKYKKMKVKWSTVRCTSRATSKGVMDVRLHVHPVIWLYEITLDETVASYPTSLIIHDVPFTQAEFPRRRHNFPRNFLGSDGHDTRMRNVEDQIRLKLEQCPYIQPKDMGDWMRFPPWVYFDTALALLVTLLPNIQSIRIGSVKQSVSRTQYMLAQMAKANERCSHNSNLLSRLVSIDRFQETFGNNFQDQLFDLYLPLTGFASIRSICGHAISGRREWGTFAMSHGYPPPRIMSRNDSKITEIKLTRSNISSDSFENLFGRISALRTFEYGYYPRPIDGLANFELCKIVGSLLAHASHSLVHFDLTMKMEDCGDTIYKMVYLHGQIFIGSLREFRVLKTIRANNTMFIKRVPSPGIIGRKICKIHRLVDLLPQSTEEVQLAGLELVQDYQCSGIFDDFVKLQAHNLPNLKAVKLDYFDPVAPALRTACHEVGVDFTFIDN